MAASMSPLDSVRASLHSMTPTPVFSRRSLTIAAVIVMTQLPDRKGNSCSGIGFGGGLACLDLIFGCSFYQRLGRLFHADGGTDHRAVAGAPFNDRIGNRAGDQANGSDRIIVPGDHIANFIRIAIRIHEGDRGDRELAGLAKSNAFLLGIDDENSPGKTVHILDR